MRVRDEAVVGDVSCDEPDGRFRETQPRIVGDFRSPQHADVGVERETLFRVRTIEDVAVERELARQESAVVITAVDSLRGDAETPASIFAPVHIPAAAVCDRRILKRDDVERSGCKISNRHVQAEIDRKDRETPTRTRPNRLQQREPSRIEIAVVAREQVRDVGDVRRTRGVFHLAVEARNLGVTSRTETQVDRAFLEPCETSRVVEQRPVVVRRSDERVTHAECPHVAILLVESEVLDSGGLSGCLVQTCERNENENDRGCRER